jgi:hypothetical protein
MLWLKVRLIYGGITSLDELKRNLEMHCIPFEIIDMDVSNYEEFLEKRRKLMALKVKRYFSTL